MSWTVFEAAVSPWVIIGIIIYVIRLFAKGNKKKNRRSPQKPKRKPSQNQPGKSIEEILKEMEKRASGKKAAPEAKPANPTPTPSRVKQKDVITVNKPVVRTVEDYRNEKHSDMDLHHTTQEELHDGNFDALDERIHSMEHFETSETKSPRVAEYSIEDMRKAIVLEAILNRPDF